MKNKNLRKTAIVFLLISVILSFIWVVSCKCSSDDEEKPSIQDDNPNVFISGTISGAIKGNDKAIVMLFPNRERRLDKNTITVTTSAKNNWRFQTFLIKVDVSYDVCAFIDSNDDGYFSMGENWGCNIGAIKLSKDNTNAICNIIIRNFE